MDEPVGQRGCRAFVGELVMFAYELADERVTALYHACGADICRGSPRPQRLARAT